MRFAMGSGICCRSLQVSMCALTVLLLIPEAVAQPSGAQVHAGQVDFSLVEPGVLQITNSPNAIIDWRSFSIGAGETTRFIQQHASSSVLNRVVGQDLSSILGRLESNGQVFLVNPHGIFFGPDAVVDVAGLVASTLNLSNEDFLQGSYRFLADDVAPGSILNEGTLRALHDVLLIAPDVSSSGTIIAEQGNVLLAAGASVLAVDPQLLEVEFEIQSPDDRALNLGEILANGVAIHAGTIEQAGQVQIASDGTIRLLATGDNLLQDGATLTAPGGNIDLLGARIALMANTLTDVSAPGGGGSVRIGGDYRGQGTLPTASAVYIDPLAQVRADALDFGDGGRVIVWSDELTRFYGTISALGAAGGAGGFVETSGADDLEAFGIVDLGPGGEWLLDPRNVTIRHATSSGGAFDGGNPDVFSPSTDNAVADATQIENSLAAGTAVKVTTSGGGTQNGDITLLESLLVDVSGVGVGVLTLEADGDILLLGGICDVTGCNNIRTAGDLDIALVAGGAVRFQPGAGLMRIDAGTGGITDIRNLATPTTSASGAAIFEAPVEIQGSFRADSITGNVTSGIVNLTGDVTLTSSLTWNSGDLFNQANGGITVPTFKWTGGKIFGSGAINVTGSAGTPFEISGANTKTLATTLKNQSNSANNMIAANVTANSGALIRNEGVLKIGSTSGVDFLNANGAFENASGATLNIEAPAGQVTQFFWKFEDQGGAVNFSNSTATPPSVATLQLSGANSSVAGMLTANTDTLIDFSASAFSFTAGSTLSAPKMKFSAGTVTINDNTFSATGLEIAGATVNFNPALESINDLLVTAGTLNVAGALTVSQFDWDGGALSGTGSITVPSAGQLLLDTPAGSSHSLSQLTFNHNSTTGNSSWTGSGNNGIQVSNGATFTNAGTLDIDRGVHFGEGSLTANGSFNNSGTLNIDTNTPSVPFRVSTPFNNSGIVNIDDSTGSALAFNGLWAVNGGTHTGSFNLTSQGRLTLSGQHLFQGSSSLSGGFVEFFSGSDTSTVSTASFAPSRLHLRNGKLQFDADAIVSDLSLNIQGSGTTSLTINAGRTLTVTNGFDWVNGSLLGAGTLDTTSMELLSLANLSAILDGPTLTSNGLSLTGLTGFSLRGGTLDVNGNLVLQGSGSSSAGITQSGGLLDVSGAFNINSLGRMTMTAGTLDVAGGINVSGMFLDVQGNAATSIVTPTLTINSLFRKLDNGGTATTTVTGNMVNAGGTVDVQGDLLSVTGTYTQSAGTTKMTGGTLQTGAMNLNQGSLMLTSGGLDLTGALTLGGSSTVTVNGGTLDLGEGNELTVPTGTTLNQTGGTISFTAGGLSERMFIAGTLNFDGGNINAPGGYIVENGGLFNISSAVGNTISSTSGQITAGNNGTIRKLADGSATTTLNMRMSVSQNGTFELLGGTLDASSDGIFQQQTGSVTRLLGGNLVVGVNDSALADYFRISGGELFGGSSTLTGDVFATGGTVHAGNSPGDFTISGTLNLASTSTLAVEIFGATQGTGFDHFNVNNLVVNGATMTADFGSFTPASGTPFNVIDYANFSGTGFATFTPTLGGVVLNNVGNQFVISLGAPVFPTTAGTAPATGTGGVSGTEQVLVGLVGTEATASEPELFVAPEETSVSGDSATSSSGNGTSSPEEEDGAQAADSSADGGTLFSSSGGGNEPQICQ